MKKFISSFIRTIVVAVKTFFILIKVSKRRLLLRIMLRDFFSVTSSIGFVIIPSFIFGLLFLFLPQGKDTLLLMVERLMKPDFSPFAGLLFGVLVWSYASEIGVRYAISISDNSGLNLSDERVKWRKTVQRMLCAFFLLYPPLVVLLGLLSLFFTTDYIDKWSKVCYVGGPIVIILLLIAMLFYLYFHKFGGYGPNKPRRTILGKRSLPITEQKWLDRLYGIYNDYVFSLPKATSFKQPFRDNLSKFNQQFLNSTDDFLKGFPQDKEVLVQARLVPESFQLINSAKIKDGSGNLIKWIYRIPTEFYAGLHRQVYSLATICVLTLLIISVIPGDATFFTNFGAPGLICLAFGCYIGLYAGLLFVDKALLRNWRISVRLMLVILLLASSFWNQDHPVRLSGPQQKRQSVSTNFKSWFFNYEEKMIAQYGTDSLRKYPVIFVCAEGGAFRTGAYTSIFLSSIEKALAEQGHGVDFRNSVFAMSGVSGGAVGLGYHYASAYVDKRPSGEDAIEDAKQFFLNDALSPLIGKLLYGEFINLFIPFHVARFDRAIALEQTWEKAYGALTNNNVNTYQNNFVTSDSKVIRPVFIINTTEVESGYQSWVCNYEAEGIRFAKERDLFSHRLANVRHSTAINFSNRFPLLSPAGMVETGKGTRRHYVDGGYVENTGSASMYELLQLLKRDTVLSQKITPVLITLLFAPDDESKPTQVKFLNEITEVVLATYNTRSGRTKTSRSELRQYVEAWNNGVVIDAPFRSKDVPMNWVLSGKSMGEVTKNVNELLNEHNQVMKDFFKHDLKYLKTTSSKIAAKR